MTPVLITSHFQKEYAYGQHFGIETVPSQQPEKVFTFLGLVLF